MTHSLIHVVTALALLILGLALILTEVNVGALRAQVRQDRAAYVQQEHNDRQALSGAARQIGRAATREIRILCTPRERTPQ